MRSRGAIQPGPCPAVIAESQLTAPLAAIDFTAPGGGELNSGVRAALAHVGADLDGSPRPIRAICDIRDAANAALARAHYVATVRVPEQTVSGHLKLEVVTARIVGLRVRGDPGRLAHRVAALLDRLQKIDPLNETDAERILLLAGDIPGVAVTLELRPAPSGKLGEVVGEIAVERTPYALFFNAQNYGSTQIGRYSGLLRGEVYGLTGLADRTYLGVFSTGDFKEQQVLQFGHDFAPFAGSSLRVAGQFTYAWTRPTIVSGGTGIDLRSRSLLATGSLSYPVVRRGNLNLRADGGFDFIEQRTRSNGTPINTDKLREFFVQLNGDATARVVGGLAPRWRLAGGVELRKDVDIFGATKQGQASGGAIPTRFEGDPQAFIVRANALAEGRVRFGPQSPYAITASVDARGQYSNHPLLAFDEFAVGNLTIGRGYDPDATSGDQAYGAASEIRIGKPQPLSRRDFAYEVIGFYDVIHINNLDSNRFEADRTLHSVGGGVRATWGSHGRIDIVYAKPLDKGLAIDTVKPPGRLLVSLTIRALPWR
ncbi:MAG: ShlB/FhaC/HecB family hemolysin secretion/activation protein [Sphingomonadaceae bacterium]|nr:ShlB/FhaC/HecB family hemolysin secretion/activation protein [Sphingomonadaceae bacterium]